MQPWERVGLTEQEWVEYQNEYNKYLDNLREPFMKFLTKEEIYALDYKSAKEHLKLIEKTYKVEKPLKGVRDEFWQDLDDIVNNILWIEDHIYEYEDPRFSTKAIEPEEDKDLDLLEPDDPSLREYQEL